MTPTRVGRFLVEGVVGRGGTGVVFRARDPDTGAPVAIKFLLDSDDPDGRRRRRFEREAEILRSLRHPNLVGLRETGTAEGRPYVVLDFVEGRTLEEVLEESPLAPVAAARLIRTLARALQAAHERGVVHRDLKPANVLIDRAGTPFVVDLGLAHLEGASRLTATGVLIGSVGYLAPEQAMGEGHEAGPAADVYGLGAVLYAALAQRAPCEGAGTYEAVVATIQTTPPPPSSLRRGVPPELDAICARCLEKAPEKRFASAAELGAALDRFLGGTRGDLPSRARLGLGTGVVAVLAAALFAWAYAREPGPPPLVRPDGSIAVSEAIAAEARRVAAARGAPAVGSDDELEARRRVASRALEWAKLEPDRAAPQLVLALALRAAGRHGESTEALERAVAIDGKLALAWRELARAALAGHSSRDPVACASRAAELDPRDGEALALRGRARARSGAAGPAADDLERALALGHEEPETYAWLAHCNLSLELTPARLARAEALAGRALASDASASALAARAKARLWRGDDTGAAADCELLAARGPQSEARPWMVRRAFTLAWRGDRPGALRLLASLAPSEADPSPELWRAAFGDRDAVSTLVDSPDWGGALARKLREGSPAGLAGESGVDSSRTCLAFALAGLLAEESADADAARSYYARALAFDARTSTAFDWALRRQRALQSR